MGEEGQEVVVGKKPVKPPWPLWWKFFLAGIFLVIAIPLGVVLGFGLTGKFSKGGDSSDDKTIWQPSVGDSWQIVLLKPIKVSDDAVVSPDVKIYDLDVYDNDAATIQALQGAGKKVICYFSAGSYEDWRSDASEFEDADKGKNLDGWEGEKWQNLSSPNVHKIMKERIKLASEKGCDAIDPDNVDGYANDNGLGLTAKDSVAYIKFLSTEAAKYNMSTGLKNAGAIIDTVLDYVHFSVNEQCIQYGECDTFSTFIGANKPVFNIEYPDKAPKVSTSEKNTICSTSGDAADSDDFSKVIKKMNLDGWVSYCNETQTYNTTTTNASSS